MTITLGILMNPETRGPAIMRLDKK